MHLSRVTAAAVLLILEACGGRPAPRQEAPLTASAEVAASTVQTASTQPATDSVHSMTPVTGPLAAKPDTPPSTVRKAFPGAGSVRLASEPFPHRVISDSTGRVLGYEVFSDSAGVTGRGYAGMVPVQVLLDAQARPVRIYILENCETPAYMDIISGSGLMERLLAFDPAKPDSVDAVTLATSSSRAIIAGVTGLAARASVELVATNRGSR